MRSWNDAYADALSTTPESPITFEAFAREINAAAAPDEKTINSVRAALTNYRLNSVMRNFLQNECKRACLFHDDGTPVEGALENASAAVRLWFDRYTNLSQHLDYIERAFKILCQVYDDNGASSSERLTIDILRRTFFTEQKRTTLEIRSDLEQAGTPISHAGYYRHLKRGIRLMCYVLVDPVPTWTGTRQNN